ncbi:MAG: lytic transglycosylase domain-containing protein [Bdellovibrionales bacterium]|nr:lytic transglycosylase domain-containing protein [Bdellovibrionales bacterium]
MRVGFFWALVASAVLVACASAPKVGESPSVTVARSLGEFQKGSWVELDFYPPASRDGVLARLDKMPLSERPPRRRRNPPRAAIAPEVVARHLRQGRFERLARADDRLLLQGLGFLDRTEMLRLAGRLGSGCAHLGVRYTTAARLEIFFPDDDVVRKSLAHYGKVAACGSSEFRDRAAYRQGMILHWRGDRQGAARAFSLLRDRRVDPELRLRGLYWLHRLEGKPADRGALLREFPMSLHALLTEQEAGLVWAEDSPIQTRSRSHQFLNRKLEEAEAWIRSGDVRRAARALARVVKPAMREPAGFRIYFSYLLGLGELNQTKFWMVTDLIRGQASPPLLRLLFPLKPEITRALDVDSDEALLLSLIRQESKFDAGALSHAGAVGLMQVMPATAERVGIAEPGLLWDPGENVRVGTRYLHQLLAQYENVELALAAYNAGPHRVDDWLKRYPTVDRMIFLDLIPFKETREYVAAIANNYWWYRRLYPEIRAGGSWVETFAASAGEESR